MRHVDVADYGKAEIQSFVDGFPKQDKAQDLRRVSLDIAIRLGNFDSQRAAEDIIEDAIKIENYLAGKLEAPNTVERVKAYYPACPSGQHAAGYCPITCANRCECPGEVECGDCEGVVRDDL